MSTGVLTTILLALIWVPMLFFAFLQVLGHPNLPDEVGVSFSVGSYAPLYKVEVSKENLHGFNEQEWNKMHEIYAKQPAALAFFKDYSHEDVVAATFSTSSTVWSISPPNLNQMIEEIRNESLATCSFDLKLSRSHIATSVGSVILKQSNKLKLSDELRQAFLEVLVNGTKDSVLLPNIFPKLLAVQNNGNFLPIQELSFNG